MNTMQGLRGKGGRGQKGLSAVEMVITIVFIGLVVITFASLYATLSNIVAKAKLITDISAAAANKIQEYENKQFSALPNTPLNVFTQVEDFSSTLPNQLPGQRIGRVYIRKESNTLKFIAAYIQYGSGANERYYFVGDYIQQDGLGR